MVTLLVVGYVDLVTYQNKVWMYKCIALDVSSLFQSFFGILTLHKLLNDFFISCSHSFDVIKVLIFGWYLIYYFSVYLVNNWKTCVQLQGFGCFCHKRMSTMEMKRTNEVPSLRM